MRRVLGIVLLAGWLALPAAWAGGDAPKKPADGRKSDGDWPQFRGPGGAAVSSDKVQTQWGPEKNIVWKKELPGPGSSSPIVAAGRIFVTCHSGYGVTPGQDMKNLTRHVLCFDMAGKLLWDRHVKSALPEEPYERRMHNHGYASSTPAADRERVYAFFGKSGVFALDHEGKQLWRADVGDRINGWGSGASPILYKDLVIVNASVESDSLVALNKKDGKEVWRAENIREAWNTPVLVDAGGRTELVVGVVGKVLGFDPDTGKQLWSCAGINNYMCPSAAVGDGVVYFTGGRDRTTWAVKAGGRGDVSNTHLLWKVRKGSNVCSPVLYDGRLYVVSDVNEVLYCFDARTGNTVYEERLNRLGGVYASLVIADGKIYCTSQHGGATAVVNAGPRFEEVSRNNFGERSRSNATPAISGGRLLIRTDLHLYCIGGGS